MIFKTIDQTFSRLSANGNSAEGFIKFAEMAEAIPDVNKALNEENFNLLQDDIAEFVTIFHRLDKGFIATIAPIWFRANAQKIRKFLPA